MRRDPSIHITKSSLVEILNEIKYSERTGSAKLAELIFEEAQSHQITDRYLQVINLNAKTRKKAEKSMEADDVPAHLVEKFNMLLVGQREKWSTHVKAKPISKTNKQYFLLKEVAKMAYDFVQHFEITPETDGYKEYIDIGLGFMRRYGLNRFKTYDAQIYEVFESKVKVWEDPHSDYTAQFYGIWQEAMVKHSGMETGLNLQKDPTKYAHMVYGREEADSVEAYYEDWIEAQFDRLKFLNVIPEVTQFYGTNAKKRYEEYMRKSTASEHNEDDVTNLYK